MRTLHPGEPRESTRDLEGTHGRLVALRNGIYVNVPIEVVRQGVKRVDVEALYDADEYRPKIRHVDGKPMFQY